MLVQCVALGHEPASGPLTISLSSKAKETVTVGRFVSHVTWVSTLSPSG